MREARHEVVVIGAGPAGGFTALRLAERGHDVVLLEAHTEPHRPIACSGIVGREAFEELGLPSGSTVATVDRARFVAPSGAEITYAPRDPLAYVVHRPSFDARIADRAVAAGARLIRGCRALGIEKDRGGVLVPVRSEEFDRIRARAVVLASGHRPGLHGPAGLGEPSSATVALGVEYPFQDLDAAEVYFGSGAAPGYFAWAVPAGPGRARLGVLASSDPREVLSTFLVSDAIRPRMRGDSVEDCLCDAKGRRVVQGMVLPSYADSALAVGEAAGQVKTTTLGGIYYGLIGADLAAEVLSDGLRRNRIGARHLARYERAWTRKLRGEIEMGLELQRVAWQLSDPEIDALFATLGGGLAAAVERVVRFDWHRPALKMILKRALKRWDRPAIQGSRA
jgi:geranylgeranyl reductase family protein